MPKIVHASDLSDRDKRLLFWASFLALVAAGFGFAFRVAKGSLYGAELGLTEQQVGEVFGASLWPIAITMIGFSLVVDRTGYKLPMYCAFALQALSGIGTVFAAGYTQLYLCALSAGLGHGIVEAVINPICAAVYPKEKTKWLTYLHAAWPAGLVGGTLLILGADALQAGGFAWRLHALWILLPCAAYALMYLPCTFPVDERVQAGVPYREMLQQVGFLTSALASGLVIYEIGNQVFQLTTLVSADAWVRQHWFGTAMALGLAVGTAFGLAVGSIGRPLFFLMCLLMIPVATAELGTDGWINRLMKPVLEGHSVNPALALVFSAAVMLVLRTFAGGILRFFSPPGLLFVSGIFSALGLFWLSEAAGIAIFVAFTLYALGQTFYWPCVLGFTAERYPQGGALTLNTVSAIGLLTAGVVGTPILGVAFDRSIHAAVERDLPALSEAATVPGHFMWMQHEKIDPQRAQAWLDAQPAEQRAAAEAVYSRNAQGTSQSRAGRDVLAYSARFPLILMVAFGAIALWFRQRGGYRPVELSHAET